MMQNNLCPGPKFKVGQRVTFKNDQGVTFLNKTILEVEATEKGFRYFYSPSDSPWAPVREDQLK